MASLIIGGQASDVHVGVGNVGGPAPADASVPDVSSWGLDDPRPRARRRLTAAAVAVVTLAFVPVVTAPVTAAGGGGGLRTTRTYQYQALAGPVFVPTAATAPFVAPVAPERLTRVRAPRLSGSVGPIYLADVTAPAPPLSWASSSASPSHSPKRQATGETAPPFQEAAPALPTLTAPVAPDRASRAARRLISDEAAAPIYLADVTDPAPALSWVARAPERLRLTIRALQSSVWAPVFTSPEPEATAGGSGARATRLYQYQALSGPVFVPTEIPPVVPEWFAPVAPSQRPTRLARLSLRLNTAPLVELVAPPPAAPDLFEPTAPTRQALGLRRVRLATTVLVELVTAPTTPDLVAASAPDRQQARRLRAGLRLPAEPLFGVVVDVPVQSWTGHYPDTISRRRRVAPASTIAGPLYIPDVTTVAPPLSWEPIVPERTRRALAALSSQHLASVWYPVTPGEVPVPDQWTPIYPDRTRSAPRGEGLTVIGPIYLSDVTDPSPALAWSPRYPDRTRRALALTPGNHQAFAWHSVTPGDVVVPPFWAPVYPDRTRRPPHGEPLVVIAPLYVPDVTVVAPVLAWEPSYPDRVRYVRLEPALHLHSAWNTETPTFTQGLIPAWVIRVPEWPQTIVVPEQAYLVIVP